MAAWEEIGIEHLDSECGYYSEAYYSGDALEGGTDVWRCEFDSNEGSEHDHPDLPHWIIIDLGTTKTVTRVRGRSDNIRDPTDIDVYVSDDKEDWGSPVAEGIDTWQDTDAWQIVDVANKNGRYVKFVINATEDASDRLMWGKFTTYETILDIETEEISGGTIVEVGCISIGSSPQGDTLNLGCKLTPSIQDIGVGPQVPVFKGGVTVKPNTLGIGTGIENEIVKHGITITPGILSVLAGIQAGVIKVAVKVSPGVVQILSQPLDETILTAGGVTINPDAITLILQPSSPIILSEAEGELLKDVLASVLSKILKGV